jgi:hypothetical protein
MYYFQTVPRVFVMLTLIVMSPPLVTIAQTAQESLQSAPKPIDRAEVDSLIRQLGSAKRTTRTQAEKALQSFGPALLDLLPPSDLVRNVAARQAVRRIRIQLEGEAAKQSLKPRRVTLQGSFTISDLTKKIAEQTGNPLRVADSITDRTKRPMIQVDWRDATFWEAMQRLEESGWFARFDSESGDLLLSRTAGNSMSVTSNREAVRIRVAPLSRKAISDEEVLLQTRVSVECEPRLRPLFLNFASDDLSLKLGTKSASSFDAGAKIELPLGISGREAVFQPRFLSEQQADTADLLGKVSLLLAAAERPIEFSRLGEATGVARRRGGVTVVVSSVRLDQKDGRHSARVRIRVSYDLGVNAFESHQTWVFHNRVWLTAGIGKTATRVAPKSFDTLFQNESGVGIEYVFSDLDQSPATMSFVYLAPTQLIRVTVKLDIVGLPIVNEAD